MSGRSSENPNFVRNRSLLGQYLHGKASLVNLSLGLAAGTNFKPPAGKSDVSRDATTTTDFLGNLGKSSSQQGMMKSTEHKTGQLTIFYSGKLVVFDDFPADKARAVMLLASKVSPNPRTASTADKINRIAAAAAAAPLSLHHAGTNGSHLPIARRSSLQKFLEKRKDRLIARAPYQLHNNKSAFSSSSKNRPFSFNNGDDDSSSNYEEELPDLNFKL